MKKISLILLIYASALIFNINADRILPVRCLPVDIDRKVWSFIETDTDTDNEGIHPIYRVYGDTLLTEVLNGKRQWYSFSADSCYYLGEESRLIRMKPSAPIPTSALGHFMLGSLKEERDSGSYCRTYSLEGKGTYESLLPVEGEIRAGDNKTLKAKAVTEIRRMIDDGDGIDDIKDRARTVTENIRTRWFVAGDPLPVALQSTERIFIGDTPSQSVTNTYILDTEEILERYEMSDSDSDILESITAVFEGNILRIGGTLPPDINLQIVLANIQGIPVMEAVIDVREDWQGSELTVPPLIPGRYVLSVGSGGSVRRIFLTKD
ncbi:MAG: hypothetical protein K2J82_02760 [Muribaculaceae bacterium]|nr:hypothetical protein [Muribaculaceae bacterium]